LELSKPPDIETLKQRSEEFQCRFPLSGATLRQIGRHYYWCNRQKTTPLFHLHHCPDNHSETEFHHNATVTLINEKQVREETAPVEFHLLQGPTTSILLIRWLHPFCDARGADLILKYLCTQNPDERRLFGEPQTGSLVNEQLNKYRWWEKISLLMKAKRHIKTLDQLESIQPFNNDQSPQGLNYRVHRLTIEETHQIEAQARKYTGIMATSLYYFGCLIRALEKLNPESRGQAYCVPYAFNLRKQKALTPITGNHVCALFAQVPRAIVNNRKQLFDYLKKQNVHAIREQLDYAFLPMMWAGSWLSLQKYGKILRHANGSGKERSSFWFSDIGRLDMPTDGFPGSKITGVFHSCQITTPPGLALLSCIYRGQLTLSYNFIEPVLHVRQANQLHRLMRAELLGQNA
jgi:NRPS condensation-like uncharacterized protein